MPHRRVLIALVCLVLFAPPTRGQDASATPDYRTINDIVYRQGDDLPEDVRTKCLLDLYYPAHLKDYATVVWIHGGGLSGGKRGVPLALRNKGFAVVAVGYRLHPSVKAPVYIEDAAAAVAWTIRHIAEHGGNPRQIFLSGHSAGGYLAAMVSLDKRWLAAHQIDPDHTLAGVIPLSGQAITHLTVRKERGIANTQPVIDDLAPLYHVRKDAPPLLLITGDRNLEMIGRYEENAYLWRMMKVVGHTDTELLEVQGYNHGQMTEAGYPILVRFIRKRTESAPAVPATPAAAAPAEAPPTTAPATP